MNAASERLEGHHSKRRRGAARMLAGSLPFALAMMLAGMRSGAAGAQQTPSPPPAAASQQPSEPKGASAQEPQPFDPYHAEKSIEAGTFYLKKGHYDAAIARFEEALQYRPNLAKAYLLLGEAYEKKGERPAAVQNYKKYLEIVPSAGDAGKIRKRIEKLSREVEQGKSAKRRSG